MEAHVDPIFITGIRQDQRFFGIFSKRTGLPFDIGGSVSLYNF